MQTNDPLPYTVVELIAARYGYRIRDSSRLEAGDEARTWRATAQRALFVHESPPWRTVEELAWCHRLMEQVARLLPEAVPPLHTVRGETFVRHGTTLITLYPWVSGQHLDREDPAQRRAAAGLLAQIHRALLACTMPPRPAPARSSPLFNAPPDPPAFAAPGLDRACAHIERLGLTRGLVHGDYYRRNVLWADGQMVAVVDWHEARHGLLVAEVANAAWQFGKDASGRRPIRERLRQFLDDYAWAGGPGETSRALMVPLIRRRLREEARVSRGLSAQGLPTDVDHREVLAEAFIALRDYVI